MSDDPKLSQRYRELPREEPPRHVDDAILAAARRAVHPRRRWYVPLATAAVIILAVAVTMHVDRERPGDAETVVAMKAEPAPPPREEPRVMQAPPAAGPAPAEAPTRKAVPQSKGFVPDPQPQARPEAAPTPAAPPLADSAAQGREDYERRVAGAESARLQAEAEPPRAERQADLGRFRAERSAPADTQKRRAVTAEPSATKPAATAALGIAGYQSPEQWLLGIDDLKRQGRHEEAEKQLAEFRKRYPDYRIPEAITEKFEKR